MPVEHRLRASPLHRAPTACHQPPLPPPPKRRGRRRRRQQQRRCYGCCLPAQASAGQRRSVAATHTTPSAVSRPFSAPAVDSSRPLATRANRTEPSRQSRHPSRTMDRSLLFLLQALSAVALLTGWYACVGRDAPPRCLYLLSPQCGHTDFKEVRGNFRQLGNLQFSGCPLQWLMVVDVHHFGLYGADADSLPPCSL